MTDKVSAFDYKLKENNYEVSMAEIHLSSSIFQHV